MLFSTCEMGDVVSGKMVAADTFNCCSNTLLNMLHIQHCCWLLIVMDKHSKGVDTCKNLSDEVTQELESKSQ